MSEPNTDVPPEAAEFFNALAVIVDQILNGKEVTKNQSLRKSGFVLLVYPVEANDERCNLISNGTDPTKIIRLMKEQVAMLEKSLQ